MQNRWGRFALAVVAAIPMFCHAQTNMFEPERVGRWYVSAAAGAIKDETSSQLVNLDGQFGLAIGAGYRLTPHVALEIEGLLASQRVDTSSTIAGLALGANGGDVYIRGIGGLAKFILPLNRV